MTWQYTAKFNKHARCCRRDAYDANRHLAFYAVDWYIVGRRLSSEPQQR